MSEYILGIDLGTTNSEVAVYRDGETQVLESRGNKILPSVVGVDANGRLLVGEEARNQALLAPERTVQSIKRHMGETYTVRLGDRDWSPEEISAVILRTLRDRAVQSLGVEVNKAVITVPAFFNDNQRVATRKAGELAGLEVVRIINEPTAATLTYPSHSQQLEHIVVYDLGGGTFDVSIVRLYKGIIEVLASYGDTHLGGDDFDKLLFDYVCDRFKKEHGINPADFPVAKSRLSFAVEKAKIALSTEPFVRIEEEFLCEKEGKPINLSMEISRIEYEKLIFQLLVQTIDCIQRALDDAKLNISEIDKFELVGGSSRTPLVYRMLNEAFHRPIHTEVNPDLCVALGAAIQGALISGEDVGPILIDVTPHTLGVAALDLNLDMLQFAPLIHRNTPIPCKKSEVYKTVKVGQKQALISVYQGESEVLQYNTLIGEFTLADLPSTMQCNLIVCTFELNINGILKVTAIEKSSGKSESIILENILGKEDSLSEKNSSCVPPRVETSSIPKKSKTAAKTSKKNQASSFPLVVELFERSEKAMEKANDNEKKQIQTLIAKLKSAMEAGKNKQVDSLTVQLDDLLFYLQEN